MINEQQKQQLAKLFNVSVSDVLTDCKSYYNEDVMLNLARDVWLTFNTKERVYRFYKCERVDFYDPWTESNGENYFDINLPISIEMHKKITKALEILDWK